MKYAVYSMIALAVSVFCGTVLMKAITKKNNSGKGKRILLAAVLSVLIFTTGFLIYLLPYQKAEDTPALLMQETAAVEVIEEKHGKTSDIACKAPEKSNTAIIFYPGAKVDPYAYVTLATELAENGIDIYIIKMPFHMAVFQKNAADGILEDVHYDHVYLAGHSLGGTMAAQYTSEHETVEGVILLASYPTKPLNASQRLLSVAGDQDGCLEWDVYENKKENWPEDSQEVLLKGGNHAQFGTYGKQRGDNEAFITNEEQIDQTVKAILQFLHQTGE